ncbi:MAG: hypothetical protein GY950_23760 [bacterium]|nr:hypothetical protein [bacterium]
MMFDLEESQKDKDDQTVPDKEFPHIPQSPNKIKALGFRVIRVREDVPIITQLPGEPSARDQGDR